MVTMAQSCPGWHYYTTKNNENVSEQDQDIVALATKQKKKETVNMKYSMLCLMFYH